MQVASKEDRKAYIFKKEHPKDFLENQIGTLLLVIMSVQVRFLNKKRKERARSSFFNDK